MTKLHNVQLLRAVAALMVVCVHLSPLFGRFDILPPTGGVDLFFVISGFIMVYIASDRAPGEFLVRRAIRIIPLYWTLTLLTFACAALVPTLFQNTSANPASLVKSLLFIPFTKGDAEMPQPILFVGWSLNYEIFFYLLFAGGLAIGRRGLAVVFAALILLPAIGTAAKPTSTLGMFYTSPLLFEFALGMAVAVAVQRWSLGAPFAIALSLIAIPLVFYGDRLVPDLSRVISIGMPAAVLLASAIALDRKSYTWPRLSAIGDASYAIYLIHPFITAATVVAAGYLPNRPAVTIALIGAALATVCLIGRLVYLGFERPITRAMKERRTPSNNAMAGSH